MTEHPDRLSDDVADALRRAGADRLGRGGRPERASRGGWAFDPRPTSPVQVLIVGGVLLLGQWLRLYAALGLGRLGPTLALIGLLVLAVGVASWLVRPPRRDMYWRGRRIELRPSDAWQHRLYYLLYRDR